ncbi:PepSY domain-containing protein [Photobacterium nomapromontoriensis]|uniref:PepSY domain-containing protein n=1 Tax=Photobacterium nomapromontoriensis TaxID=2910237 RepID=UPI003D1152D0
MQLTLKYILVVLMGVMPVLAFAKPVGSAAAPEITVPKAMQLLQDKGYHDFRKIKVERDENEIEVEARNAAGQEVEIELDLFSGKILDIE